MKQLLLKFILRLYRQDLKIAMPKLEQEQRYGLMSEMYQNHAVRLFLDMRERYLIDITAKALMESKVPDAKYTAGQVNEIRNMRNWMRMCYNYTHKHKEEKKKSILNKSR